MILYMENPKESRKEKKIRINKHIQKGFKVQGQYSEANCISITKNEH